MIAELLDTFEAQKGLPRGHTKIVPLVETAGAYFRLRDIAKASPRIVALSLGAEDFALALSMEPMTGAPEDRPSGQFVASGPLRKV